MHLVFLLFALFASLFGLSKAALNYSEPFFLIGARMTLAGLILTLYQLLRNPQELQLAKKNIWPLIILGFFAIYLTNITEIWGLQHMISARTCLIYSLSPFLSALFSYFIFKEILTSKQWLGLTVGFIGLGPILFEGLFSNNSSAVTIQPPMLTTADLAVLVAVVTSVYGWILLKKITHECKMSFLTANGISMLLGGILALAHSYIAGESWSPLPIKDLTAFWQYTLAMCLISNVICYNLYGYLLKSYSATFMAFAGLVTPLFASLFGWFFLAERVSPLFFLSFVLFSIGLTLFHSEELQLKKRVKAKFKRKKH